VDDHPVYRDGLAMLLSTVDDIEIVDSANDGVEAIRKSGKLQPDVIIMDIQMPNIDGIEATRRIYQAGSDSAILMLTMSENDEAVFEAMRAGARGYLVKGATQDEIVRSIHAVASGGAVFGAGVGDRITAFLRGAGSQAGETFGQLSGREIEVLNLIAAGFNNGEIAQSLFLSDKTVRNTVSAILSKLSARDRPEIIIRAREAGLGRIGDAPITAP
jgi:DNA-binding NarL/FixJ family response regulator